MKRRILFISLNLAAYGCFAQFAPPAGQIGTTAIHKDSSVFVGWATGCSVTRGYQDISNTSLGYASAGDSSLALGMAGSNGVVSLGDGGSAILSFAKPIRNGAGWDFAVFENSFSDTFLELAYVEVSSDGENYFRFPCTSYTQDTVQVGSFGSTDATKINNLAGKYKALYGTPFDLQELANQGGLDVNNITRIKIIDVVGCIQNLYARYDQHGNKINDPWNTAFASGGFDLDAVGVIHDFTSGIQDNLSAVTDLRVFPNPVKDKATVQYYLDTQSDATISITDLTGKSVYFDRKNNQLPSWHSVAISCLNLNEGIYLLKIETSNGSTVQKIIISNE